jgi:cytochrome c biogenesis protein CcmG, thiol:disulfide interchange protein DsbE
MILLLILVCVAAPVRAEREAPSFVLPDLSGEMVRLEDLLENGPVVLDFWATWCGPCVRELPKIQELHEEFSDSGVTFVGICDDGPKTLSRVKPFVRGRKLTFLILLDTDNEVMRRYKIANLPYTCIIGQDGTIAYGHFGYKPGDEEELRAKLVEHLVMPDEGE